MTDLVRQATIETTKNRELLLPTNDGPLRLTGGVPQIVNVRVDADKIVNLSVPGGTEEFIGGIAWRCDGYALMITFVFTTPGFEIIEMVPVTPVLWFSDTHTVGETLQQGCCVPSVAGTYSFNVKYKKGTDELFAVDPKIVVTPITSGIQAKIKA